MADKGVRNRVWSSLFNKYAGRARYYPVRYAEADEFEEDLWVIPGAKMKGAAGKTPDQYMLTEYTDDFKNSMKKFSG